MSEEQKYNDLQNILTIQLIDKLGGTALGLGRVVDSMGNLRKSLMAINNGFEGVSRSIYDTSNQMFQNFRVLFNKFAANLQYLSGGDVSPLSDVADSLKIAIGKFNVDLQGNVLDENFDPSAMDTYFGAQYKMLKDTFKSTDSTPQKQDLSFLDKLKKNFESTSLGEGFKGNKLKEDFNYNLSGGAAGMQATQGFNLKNSLKSGANTLMAGPKLAGGLAKGVGASMMGSLAALGPQMAAATLVLKPISALLEGIMEPLEPITELFGAVGQILGVLLVPIVNQIMRILLPILPILVDVIKMLLPVIDFLILPLTFLGNLMQGLGPIIGMVTGVVAELFGAFQPLIDMLGENKGMVKLLEVAMAILTPVMEIVGGFVETLSGWITTLVGWIQDLATKISNAFGNPLDKLVDALNGNKDTVEKNTLSREDALAAQAAINDSVFTGEELGIEGKNNMRWNV